MSHSNWGSIKIQLKLAELRSSDEGQAEIGVFAPLLSLIFIFLCKSRHLLSHVLPACDWLSKYLPAGGGVGGVPLVQVNVGPVSLCVLVYGL